MSMQQKLLEAHIQFELQQWQPEQLSASLRNELLAIHEWLESIRLQDLVTPEILQETLSQIFSQQATQEQVLELIRDGGQRMRGYLETHAVFVETLIPRAIPDLIVERLSEADDLRDQMIHEFVNSSIYAKLLSEVLYNSLKNFMLNENMFTKKIPGASKILKFGQQFMTQSGLEESLEKPIKEFIQHQIQESIRLSETFLKSGIDSEMLGEWKDQLWEAVAEQDLAELWDKIPESSSDIVADAAETWWEHLQETVLVEDFVEESVKMIFERYGELSVKNLIARYGWDEEGFVKEGIHLLTPWFQQAFETGFLEQRIRSHLEPFYQSETVAAILQEDETDVSSRSVKG